MCRKLICLLSITFVLTLACTTYGVDTVIGDFENSNMDNWVAAWEGSPTLSLSSTANTVTSGSQSLAVKLGGGGYWCVQWNAPSVPRIKAGTTLKFDLTMIQSEWTQNNWTKVADKIALNTNVAGTWKEYQSTIVITDRVTGLSTAADWGPWNPDALKTYSVDISDYPYLAGATSFSIMISLQQNPTTGVGNFYIDNVQLLGLKPEPTGPKVIFVTDTPDIDQNGVLDDQDWIDWLETEGYDVDARRANWQVLDPNKIAELNAAGVIILSRGINTGNYNQAGEPNQWNGLTAPVINLNVWLVRNNRMKWMNSADARKDAGSPPMMVLDTTHPIFAGLAIDADGLVEVLDPTVGSGGTSFLFDILDVGNGTLLAQSLGLYNSAWVAEWPAGVEYYAGAGLITGGKRIMFSAGSQDGVPGQTVATPQGAFNLNAEGQKLLNNIIAYLTAKPVVGLVHQYTFEDGTANDSVGDAHGTLVGDAYIADGALVTVDQDDWMEMPGDIIAMNAYNEVTIEAWYTPEAGANTSWSMLAYFGDNVNGLGNDGFFITSARGDNKSRAAISIGDAATPWASESGADGPEYDDGILHQMVSTINATDITLYIDGVLIATTPLSARNKISGISQNFAYLAKGGYGGDPEWIGAIQEFNIYNKALSAGEIAANYAKGPVTPLVHSYTFEDGTAKDSVGDADGMLAGDAYIADGALVTVDQDDWMEMPGDIIAMNTYNEVTIEAWYTPQAGGNTGWSMLAYFGDNVNGLGNDGFFITSARGDNKSRAAISIGDAATPWASESGADGPEYDDGILHQMVGTINATDITLYIDGVLIASTPLSATNSISGISQKLAYLAKGGYGGDPEWIGAIDEFNIYNRALSEAEIAANYAKGPQKGVNPGTEGLVAYYALENNADDSSGNGLNGTEEIMGAGNAATYVAGVAGMAIDLLPSNNGTVGPYVNCGADPLFDFTDAVTVGAWVNFRSVPDEWRAIVTKGDNAWRLSNVGATTAFQFSFAGYGVRPGNVFSADGTIEVGFDSWHYVCGTYDITEGAKLYVDGVLDVMTPDTVGIDLNTNDVWIGGNNGDTGWKPYRLFDGMIDEVKIYNRALSAAEILYLVNN